MERNARDRELLTFPALRRQYLIGLHTIRQQAARGAFPVYTAGTSWPRVERGDFERWLRSTRVEVAAPRA